MEAEGRSGSQSASSPRRSATSPAPAAPGHRSLVVALAAGLCWAGALVLLFLGELQRESNPLALQRLLFYMLVLGAGLLTFVPAQRAMGLPRLAIEGVTGTTLLLYTVAFVPPPTDWLLALPDLPVYALLLGALFWSTAALALPLVYAIGQRVLRQRAHRLDVRRAWRQAYEVGLFVACAAALGALDVLTWVSLLLLALILVVAELLFLSQVRVRQR